MTFMSSRLFPVPRTLRNAFHTSSPLRHDNPLGLPQKGSIPRMRRGLPEKRPIKDVAKIVAVSSAKGGVGKSTVAANLSLAFARLGYRSGILDTDLFGPSIPTLFNLSGEPRLSTDGQMIPLTNYGVKTMSMGYLMPPDAPLVWRGLMVMETIQQLLRQVVWAPGLDILILDMPPGTGDTQLSIAQMIPLDGSIVVTTPHALALADVTRGIGLFRKMNIDVLGVVDNMSVFECPGCKGQHKVFGGDERLKQVCQEQGVDILADIPLHQSVGDDAQKGKPTVVSEPDSTRGQAFIELARKVGVKIGLTETLGEKTISS